MRIYLAASRGELADARHFMSELRKGGHEITHDWIADIDRNGPDDAEVPAYELHECAEKDLRGVRTADLLWLMSPSSGGSGCFVEFGYAIAFSVPVVVSGDIDRTLFIEYVFWKDQRVFGKHSDALEHILRRTHE